MFLALDGTFWVQLVSFVVFYALLNVVFLRPVSAAIRKRREYINGVTRDYDTYQAEANVLRKHAEGLRAQARRAAEQSVAQSRAETSNLVAEMAVASTQRVNDAVAEATRTVQAEAVAARANEPQLVRQLADAMLEQTLAEATK